jgi:Arc/MetJ-type ribon-helix-helix transcriptional regulator
MKRTNIYITEIQQKRFKQIAKQRGGRSSELIRRALDEWLEKYDAKKSK